MKETISSLEELKEFQEKQDRKNKPKNDYKEKINNSRSMLFIKRWWREFFYITLFIMGIVLFTYSIMRDFDIFINKFGAIIFSIGVSLYGFSHLIDNYIDMRRWSSFGRDVEYARENNDYRELQTPEEPINTWNDITKHSCVVLVVSGVLFSLVSIDMNEQNVDDTITTVTVRVKPTVDPEEFAKNKNNMITRTFEKNIFDGTETEVKISTSTNDEENVILESYDSSTTETAPATSPNQDVQTTSTETGSSQSTDRKQQDSTQRTSVQKGNNDENRTTYKPRKTTKNNNHVETTQEAPSSTIGNTTSPKEPSVPSQIETDSNNTVSTVENNSQVTSEPILKETQRFENHQVL